MIKKGLLLLFLMTLSVQARLVRYNFDIDYINANVTGKVVKAMAINGSIPAPTITATEGDALQVTFNNKMDVETSIHWHGILLPNDQDGVPYLTTQPIKAHSSFTYQYKVIQAGTYWYHSHTGLQEERGLYGALVFYPKKGETKRVDKEYVLVLSDWTNENPAKILANLKKDGDYYALKKDTVQSWYKVLKYGKESVANRVSLALSRMGAMDLSDIGYDAFTANGKVEEHFFAQQSQVIKVRIINAAASSYFNVEFAGGPMTVVAADGLDVEPQKVQRLKIAVAETYDVLLKIPGQKNYELRATAEDGTGYSSTFIGHGEKIFAPDIAKPNLFLMQHGGHDMHKHHNHKPKKVEHIAYMNNYNSLRSLAPTAFPDQSKKRTIVLDVTGSMERFRWSFNNKTLTESDKILIKKGEIVHMVFNNKTMMHHPLHLHGHFFRVLNGQDDYAPLKHTVNVPAMGFAEIEFLATEDKDWFFHCHNLYHMAAGMARVISYADNKKISKNVLWGLGHDNDWYFFSDLAVLSNMAMGEVRASNKRNTFKADFDANYNKLYELELFFARNFTRYFDIYAGANFEKRRKKDKKKEEFIFGIWYVLPLWIEVDLRVSSRGKARIEVGSDMQLTDRLKFEWLLNSEREYRTMFSYEFNKKFLATFAYDSEYKTGIGVRAKF